MKFHNLLFTGLAVSWTTTTVLVEFQPLIKNISIRLIVLLLLLNLVLMVSRLVDLNKTSDTIKQIAAGQQYLVLNFVNVLLAGGLLVLSDDLKYWSLSLGLPSLVAIICAYRLKINESEHPRT